MAQESSGVIVISGDREVARLLCQEGVIVYPACSCYYDGFANDTFSEYANPSIVRPGSVRRARLQSTLSANFFQEAGDLSWDHPLDGQERLYHSSVRARLFLQPGTFYVGWTMYDQAGGDENLTVWLGAQKVAYVRSDDDDNRVHLYVLEQPFYIDDGERLSLVTDPTGGAYRIENVVLLPALPQPTAHELRLSDISLEVDRSLPGEAALRLNWRTSAPACCRVDYGIPGGGRRTIGEEQPLQNHSLVLAGAAADAEAVFAITATDARGRTTCSAEMPFARSLPASTGNTASGRIAFHVCNEAGEPARACPLTWGFPFPRSALWHLSNCRVVTPAGDAVGSQKRIQVTWDDGSIRWLLIDVQVDLPVEGLDLAVEYGPDIVDEPPCGVAIVDGRDTITIDAGALRLTLARDGYVFPASIERRAGEHWLAAVVGGSEPAVVLVDATGKAYDRPTVESMAVEESGPLRAVAKVVLRHGAGDGTSLFRSVVRLSAYHGKPFVRVQHTWENDNVADLFTSIRSLTLNASLAGGLSGASTGDPADGPVRLLQSFDDRYEVTQKGAAVASGVHAADWVTARYGTGCAAIVMRDFWENYPKGWQIGGEAVAIDICPDVSGVAYPSGGIEEVRSFFYLQGGVYRFKHGMTRTHDMLIVVADDEDAALAPRPQFVRPPLVRLAPALLANVGALSRTCVRGEPGADAYDRWTDEALGVYEADRAESRAYGMLNYGDWFGERRSNWGDMEYDTPYGFVLEYLRGGSSRFFTLGWQAAWHLADVDTAHYHADPLKAGRQYLHSLGHVGDYYPDAYIAGAISREVMSWSHTWVEGLYLYALLTGERRLMEAADRTVAIAAGADLNHYDFENCRESGWPLRHLIGAYQATGRRQYLNGARIIVERVLERQRPTGGWERLMVPGHCFHVPPRHMGNAGFMVGVLLAALKRFHEETGDGAVGDAIVSASAYLVRSMWEPADRAFRYTSCPQSKTDPELNTQVLEGVAYGWRLSGDAALRDALVEGLPACLTSPHGSGTPPDGKDISMRMRSMPFIVYDAIKALTAERSGGRGSSG